MSLFKQIKTDQVAARKAKDSVKASLLTTLIGEIQGSVTGGKAPVAYEEDGVTLKVADDETLKVIKKFLKNAQETIRLKDNPETRQEIETLDAYLPKQLSDEQLKAAVDSILANCTLEGGKRMGYVMGQLKQQYPDQFDASKVKGMV